MKSSQILLATLLALLAAACPLPARPERSDLFPAPGEGEGEGEGEPVPDTTRPLPVTNASFQSGKNFGVVAWTLPNDPDRERVIVAIAPDAAPATFGDAPLCNPCGPQTSAIFDADPAAPVFVSIFTLDAVGNFSAPVSGSVTADDNCTAPHPPAGVAARLIVDQSTGIDTTATAQPATATCTAFRTITAALGVSRNFDTVFVAPGTYDADAGEVFPLSLPTGLRLVGDVGSKGAAGPQVIGGATVGEVFFAAFVADNLSVIEGFQITGRAPGVAFGVATTGAGIATVRNNTFNGNGVFGARGSASPLVEGNVFIGGTGCEFQRNGNGVAQIKNNDFRGPNLSQAVIGRSLVFAQNTVARTGDAAIFLEVVGPGMAPPVVSGNTFEGLASSDRGHIFFNSFDGVGLQLGTVRDNIFEVNRGPYIVLASPSTEAISLDLGTIADSGGNDFSRLALGAAIDVRSINADVDAIGNIFPPGGPTCDIEIRVVPGSVVHFGPNEADVCQ